ncbi:BnaC09g11630D [Brassica napus]|uniref:Uncharacterized protein n=2 Tax=Brassica TaxID=3705 RepID=A0A0D3E400_BRAOL|nr:unnamed protein product [Brassica napus]CDY25538.1 BnaC09g11630D [Brassica napus]
MITWSYRCNLQFTTQKRLFGLFLESIAWLHSEVSLELGELSRSHSEMKRNSYHDLCLMIASSEELSPLLSRVSEPRNNPLLSQLVFRSDESFDLGLLACAIRQKEK